MRGKPSVNQYSRKPIGAYPFFILLAMIKRGISLWLRAMVLQLFQQVNQNLSFIAAGKVMPGEDFNHDETDT